MKLKAAIVILNWNGANMLQTFLPSVMRYSQGDDLAVFVADNGSTDDSVAMLQRDFPDVHVIQLPENYGFAEGYNQALKQIDATYYMLLNSDVEVTEQWIHTLLNYMDAHPATAACQPKLLSYNEKQRFEYAGACGGFMDRYGYPFCRGRVFDTVEEDNHQYDTICPLFWATGAAFLIRSTDYWEVGGLDGRFFAHMEEIDLCWRLRARGKNIVCIPQSVVYHVGGATLKKSNSKKTFLNFRNNLLMLYKNLPKHELNRVMAVRCLLDYVAALKFLVSGHFADMKAVFEARRAYKAMRPDFEKERKDNLQKRVLLDIPEQAPFSLLYQYYAKGKRFFSNISWGVSIRKSGE